MAILDAAWQDARHTVRSMWRRPAFALLAVVTLALGIGVNLAMFIAAYGVLVKPLPYVDADRILVVTPVGADGFDGGFSPERLQQWLPRLRTVDLAAGYARRDVTVRIGGAAVVVPAAFVTDGFFDIVSVGDDARPGAALAERTVVAAAGWARRQTGGDGQQLVGSPLSVSDRQMRLGAVAPSGFAFPDAEVVLWAPSVALTPGATPMTAGYSRVVARMKPGVTLDQVRADVDRVALELDGDGHEAMRVTRLGDADVSRFRRVLLVGLAGALLVLAVACANVSTLFIGRGVAREREQAARKALGATRTRLAAGVLVETGIVAALAGVLGAGVGAAGLHLFVWQVGGRVPGVERIGFDAVAFLVVVCLSCLAATACAIVPAWHVVRLESGLATRAPDGRPRAWRVRAALVVMQIACSVVLLTGAGLLSRTVMALLQEDPGFRPESAVEARIVFSDTPLVEAGRSNAFTHELLTRVRAFPGVASAGFGSSLPPRSPLASMTVRFVGEGRDETVFLKVSSVTPGFLPALGARFLAGRDFERGDGAPDAPRVILSESAARAFFPDGDAIGRPISRLPPVFGARQAPLVIAIVSDIKYDALDSPAPSAVYLPWELRGFGSGYLVARTAGDAASLIGDVRRVARTIDPGVPVVEVQPLAAVMAESVVERQLRALPALGFGGLAAALALVGVLATLTTLVTERRRDLAIRAALGGSPTQVAWSIVRYGLGVTAAGLVLGLATGAVAAKALASALYGVAPHDPVTFAMTTVIIGGATVGLTWLAARRVRHIDPIAVLRQE